MSDSNLFAEKTKLNSITFYCGPPEMGSERLSTLGMPLFSKGGFWPHVLMA
jgi:hypothetical protein